MQYEYDPRGTVLCIDSYDNKVPIGRLYDTFWQSGVEFTGAIDLILQLHRLLDEKGTPDSFTTPRYFTPVRAPEAPVAGGIRQGRRATFSLRILFRQYASWQGSLLWVEGNQQEEFRSVLELLELLDSALPEKKE